jgi:hypothetical protein
MAGAYGKQVLEVARGGQYLHASWMANDLYEHLLWVLDTYTESQAGWEKRVETAQDFHEVWIPFMEACELAERIDSFLASLSTNNTAAAFARGCRDDLTTLLILADWCDEQNLPHAAAEARHLHNLTRYLLR